MNPSDMLPNLTQYEQVSGRLRHNLSDAHTHQWQDSAQRQIVQRLPGIYLRSEFGRQEDMETGFQQAFFGLAGQHSVAANPYLFLSYSASVSIDIVATYLAERNLSAGLVQPCIDAQAAILRRRGVRLIPVAEATLSGRAGLRDLLTRGDRPDALFLTLPNNPTGFALGQAGFERLARMCEATGTLLIIDWTFRFYTETYGAWDQYAVVDGIGVDYLCIEDTGKTWPTLDLKCSALVTSPHLYPQVRELHNDILLNVSPFVLSLLTAYLQDSQQRGLDATVRKLIRTNRRALARTLSGSVLAPAASGRMVSVEWIRIDSTDLTGLDLVEMSGDIGIGILPGHHFYWADHDAGSRYVRFALAREAADFALACRRLRVLIDTTPELQLAGAA